jgi:hypothetical protein
MVRCEALAKFLLILEGYPVAPKISGGTGCGYINAG